MSNDIIARARETILKLYSSAFPSANYDGGNRAADSDPVYQELCRHKRDQRIGMRGLDPNHITILRTLSKNTGRKMSTKEVHHFAGFGATPSIEGVGRRLKTMQKRGLVRGLYVESRGPFTYERELWEIVKMGASVLGEQSK